MNLSLKSLWLSSVALSMLGACGTSDEPSEPTPPDMTMPDPGEPEPVAPGPGALDPSFGTGGMKMLDMPGYPVGMAVTDDWIYVCSSHRPGTYLEAVVRRFHHDGSLDTQYGTGGEARVKTTSFNMSCRQVVARPDGSAGMVIDGTSTYAYWPLSATGQIGESMYMSTGGRVRVQDGQVFMSYSDGYEMGMYDVAGGTPSMLAKGSIMGKPDRAFLHGSKALVPGTYKLNMESGWAVATSEFGSDFSLDSAVLARGGNPAINDTMRDTVLMPDGSVLAVGGADSDNAVMAVRFGAGAPVVETHTMGSASTAYAVALDGQDRPIVVGGVTIDGHQQFMWQRYDGDLAIDASYEAGGVVIAPAPEGGGELVSVAHHGGAMWALGSVDIESGSPKTALVKIVE